MFKAFTLIWQCDRKGFLLKFFYALCTSILPLVNLYVLKLLVDTAMTMVDGNVDHQATTRLLYCVVAFCAVTFINRLFNTFATVNNDVLTQQMIDHINDRIQRQSARLDIAFFDNPDFHDTLHRAQQEAAFRPVRILENTVSLFGATVSLTGVVAMMWLSSWQVVAVMLIAAVPTVCIQLYKARRIYRFRRETTQLARRSNYYATLLTGRNYAKEMRLFGLSGYFRELYVTTRRKLVSRLLSISRRMAWLEVLASVIEVAALFLILMMLVQPVWKGAITVGTFVMLFEAFRRGQGYLSSFVGGLSGLYEHKLFINNLFEFLALEPAILSPAEPVPFPERVQRIDFDNVTFTYPGADRPAVEHCSLTAQYGEVTRIDGPNGMGKTTMLKLLMRLYDPQEGAIRINGIDIRSFAVEDLRHHVSSVFQDFVQYYLTAGDNIHLGDITSAKDARRMAEALRQADAQQVVERLHDGLDTPLGRLFDGGEELSQGQWQRLALARSLYSQAPILLLDEPTAWLDPAARDHFLQTIEEIKDYHIILLVSHIS